MYMIMLVLDNPDKLDELVVAWDVAGIRNATIVESTGIQRLRRKNIPMRYLFQSPGLTEEGHLTLFVVVEDEQMVKNCLQATEQIVTDLDGPNTGVFAAWPLTFIYGVPARSAEN